MTFTPPVYSRQTKAALFGTTIVGGHTMPAELPATHITCSSAPQQRCRLRLTHRRSAFESLFRICLLFLWTAAGIGCESRESAPGDRTTNPTWVARWSYTLGNELADPGLISSPANWAAAVTDETGYNFTAASQFQAHVPSDGFLNWTTDQRLRETAGDFLRAFYRNAGIQDVDEDNVSFFFGVNAPTGTGADDYSVTLAKGSVSNVSGVALSFVFKTKIHSLQGLTAEEKWRLTQYNVIHELGHARGLNARNANYDHVTHAGSNADICVMRINVSSNIPQNHVFCGYHKKVLRECLTIIRYDYDPSSSCARFP